MTIFVLWNKERFFLNPQATEWEYDDPVLSLALGGTTALLFGTMQVKIRLIMRQATLGNVSPIP